MRRMARSGLSWQSRCVGLAHRRWSLFKWKSGDHRGKPRIAPRLLRDPRRLFQMLTLVDIDFHEHELIDTDWLPPPSDARAARPVSAVAPCSSRNSRSATDRRDAHDYRRSRNPLERPLRATGLVASTHVNTAVHVEHCAAHIARCGRAQERDRPRDFVGKGHSAQRNTSKVNRPVAHHRRNDRGRRDAVDQYIVRPRSTSQPFHKSMNSTL